ncbi:MAG TPA: hypothetical protein VLX68_17200 [Chitinivibrionales bacterium]|nr:hypothetical protein [Chitinivibrionales bacterium]
MKSIKCVVLVLISFSAVFSADVTATIKVAIANLPLNRFVHLRFDVLGGEGYWGTKDSVIFDTATFPSGGYPTPTVTINITFPVNMPQATIRCQLFKSGYTIWTVQGDSVDSVVVKNPNGTSNGLTYSPSQTMGFECYSLMISNAFISVSNKVQVYPTSYCDVKGRKIMVKPRNFIVKKILANGTCLITKF